MHADLAFAYDGSAWSGGIAVPRVAFDGEDTSFRLEDLVVALDMEEAAGASTRAFVGTSRLRLGLLSVDGPHGAFALRDLEISNASHVVGDTWSLQVDGSLGAVEEREGPGAGTARVGGGELALRIGGLALEPLAELEAVGNVIEAEGPASDAAKAELLGAAGALWPRLMASGPVLEISRLRVDTPAGEIRAAFRAAIDASEPAYLASPLTSLPALEVDLELSLPQVVLEDWLASPRPVMEAGGEMPPWVAPAELASQRVETWLEHGHLGEHDGHYVTSLRVRRGVVRVNGRVVSFDSL
jgi:hypothetical protein